MPLLTRNETRCDLTTFVDQLADSIDDNSTRQLRNAARLMPATENPTEETRTAHLEIILQFPSLREQRDLAGSERRR